MQNKKLKTFLIILSAIFLGVAIHFANPFYAIIILIFWAFAVLASIVLIVIGVVGRKFRFLYLTGFLPFVIGFIFETGIRNHKHKKALAQIEQIKSFKIKNGRYPNDIKDINTTIEITGLVYSVNPTGTNYRIEYLMDQFNKEYFESDSGTWDTLGWND
jgi:hypothetical protein